MKKRLLICFIATAIFAALFTLAGCSQGSSESSYEPATSGTAILDLSSSVSDKLQVYSLPTEPYYVLVVGNDSRAGTVQAEGRLYADSTMLLRIDPVSYQISILSFPRDTPVTYDGRKMKLNEPYSIDGIEGQVKAIEDFTGIHIDYYLTIGLAQYVDFFNAIGGIDADVPIALGHQDIITGDYIWLEAGPQHLNGNQALVLSRVRKAFYWGDPCRQYSSRHMLENTITTCAQDPALALKNLDIMLGHFETNWPIEALTVEVKDFCEHADQIHFVEGTGPYDGAHHPEIDSWACYEDPALWADLLRVFQEGGDPTTVIPLAPMDPA